ncbi:M16 family metallopeptidase [Halarcobacter bivalviorum]|uniref:Peptidase M16 n=1 Tax=Halarcobacter bivalviorum TaxID=663364 RepID=A0AAX2A911_9BACT|nr:pitrilysin family protein [Halarcobacter bivalviorum]AXH12310.1 zinc-dependent peptidase, M16 family [Halarcobacter bivalviorum]RXK10757.1 peptidase M16 [Halarcobacter bivalviorum]
MSATVKHIKINNIDIPVIFEQDKNLPILNLQLVFKNSGYMQDKKKSGLASLSSKLLDEGTKELGSTKFAQKLEDSAISLSSSVGFETFVIELSSIKEVNDKALKLLKELLNDPNYDNKVLEKIKTIKTGSLKRKENDFDYIASKELKTLLFKNSALENPASGTIESISKIKLADIKTFLEKTIDLNNLIIVAGGDIDFDELSIKLTKLLKNLNANKENKFISVTTNDKAQTKTITKDTQQAYIYFGSPFNTTVTNEENYKAKVASFILGGSGFGSRLMEEIRVKRGLAYSAYGYVSINKSHNYFTGYLQTKLESADEAKELVSKIITDFVKDGVTQVELDAAKNFLLGSEPLRTETLSQRLNRAFTLFYKGLDFNHTQKELEKIENLKLEDLNTYIKSHDEIKNLSFSIVRK